MEPQPDPPAPTDRRADSRAFSVAVTPLQVRQVAESVAVHRAALPPSFFASLGVRFLRRYHESYVCSPHGIAFAAVRDGRLCGFVVGSAAAADHSAWVVRHRGARLALAGALAMAARPRVLMRFLGSRAGRYARGVHRRLRPVAPGGAAGGRPAQQPAVLAHIAVDDAARGLGVGERLARAFEQAARERGAPAVELVTLDGPAGASRFYERLGYTSGAVRRDDDGRCWRHFRRTLHAQPPGR